MTFRVQKKVLLTTSVFIVAFFLYLLNFDSIANLFFISGIFFISYSSITYPELLVVGLIIIETQLFGVGTPKVFGVLPEKLDLETTKISIADFYYEIDSDVTMICYIDVKIEGVEIIEELEEKEEKKTIEPAIPSPPKEEQETRCVEEETKNERECDGDKIMEETSEEKVEEKPKEVQK